MESDDLSLTPFEQAGSEFYAYLSTRETQAASAAAVPATQQWITQQRAAFAAFNPAGNALHNL
jgi:hypothetical protein